MAKIEYKRVFLVVILTVVAFVIGILVGIFSNNSSHEVDPRISIFDKITREADDSITQKILDLIDTKRLDDTLRKLTEKPRLAGTNGNKEAAYYVHQEFLQYGLESDVVDYNVTLSYPEQIDQNYVAILDINGGELFRTEVNVEGDEVPPYNAFSPSGRVQGGLVFANYARLSDFQLLKERGINCSGHIVIAKYGWLFRGNKVKNAFDAGAIGVILYSDPADYAPFSNVSGTYPDSIFLPDTGVQRGGLALNKGDQSTPGYPANEYAYRLTDDEIKQRLPQIPCLPISYRNAYNILRLMSGISVPASWKGGLNITYKLGPGLQNARKVVLNVKNKLEYRKIYNVVGKISGEIEPDRYVIMGNHRDAWVYGGSDPMSGTIIMLEIARVFGQLLQQGWRPRRTMMFCSWDAEEFGLVGSYEWVEDNIKWLYPNAVAYINLDGTISGNETILLFTVPLLQKVFEISSDKVPDPTGRYKSVLESLKNNPMYRVGQVAGGSDHVPFIHSGIPTMNSVYQYVGKVWRGPVTPLYHSRYEDYNAYKLIDPEMKCSKTLASILGEISRNLCDSPIIPFDLLNYADFIRTLVVQFSDTYNQYFTSNSLNHLLKSANTFYESSVNLTAVLKSTNNNNPLLIRQLNDRLMALEKAFLIEDGLPNNPVFKHVLHSAGSISYGSGVSFPGFDDIKQCYESQNKLTCFPKIEKHLAAIIHRIYSAARVLNG